MTTGQKIAAARNKADMTQAQLAKKMYVQVSVIRDIETGYIEVNDALRGWIEKILEVQPGELAADKD